MRRKEIAAFAVLGTLAVGGASWAAIPSSDGVIHACYNAGPNPSGQLRVIDAEAGAQCQRNEKALNFNQRGPKGDKGDKGDPGPPGRDGVDGTDGRDGVDGTDGRDGVDGAPGGASEVYIKHDRGVSSGEHANSHTTLDGLPAGRYLVSGKAVVYTYDGDRQPADCHLSTGDRSFVLVDEATTNRAGAFIFDHDAGFAELTVLDTTLFTQTGSVAMDCHVYNGGVMQIVLTATTIGGYHVQG
jgi:hypothetical protein